VLPEISENVVGGRRTLCIDRDAQGAFAVAARALFIVAIQYVTKYFSCSRGMPLRKQTRIATHANVLRGGFDITVTARIRGAGVAIAGAGLLHSDASRVTRPAGWRALSIGLIWPQPRCRRFSGFRPFGVCVT
jgi:hypothetical protein